MNAMNIISAYNSGNVLGFTAMSRVSADKTKTTETITGAVALSALANEGQQETKTGGDETTDIISLKSDLDLPESRVGHVHELALNVIGEGRENDVNVTDFFKPTKMSAKTADKLLLETFTEKVKNSSADQYLDERPRYMKFVRDYKGSKLQFNSMFPKDYNRWENAMLHDIQKKMVESLGSIEFFSKTHVNQKNKFKSRTFLFPCCLGIDESIQNQYRYQKRFQSLVQSKDCMVLELSLDPKTGKLIHLFLRKIVDDEGYLNEHFGAHGDVLAQGAFNACFPQLGDSKDGNSVNS